MRLTGLSEQTLRIELGRLGVPEMSTPAHYGDALPMDMPRDGRELIKQGAPETTRAVLRCAACGEPTRHTWRDTEVVRSWHGAPSFDRFWFACTTCGAKRVWGTRGYHTTGGES